MTQTVTTPLPDTPPRPHNEHRREDARAFIALLKNPQVVDKGQLSALKRNVGEVLPGRGVAWFPHLLRSGAARRYPELFFLVATLYDLNRAAPVPGDLGKALRKLDDLSGGNGVGRRFHLLLDADFDWIAEPDDPDARVQPGGGEMPFRLRQMIKLCASRGVGVDWVELIVDLCDWTRPDKRVQKKWARSFFKQVAEAQDTSDASSDSASSTLPSASIPSSDVQI